MGLFGDIFKTITAPGRFIAKSPIGGVAKMAAPMVMGPAGIGVSAGIGALEKSDEGVDDMLGAAVGSGAQGAASYGMGKGVGALINKYGGGAAAGGIPDAPGSVPMPDAPTTPAAMDIPGPSPAPVSPVGGGARGMSSVAGMSGGPTQTPPTSTPSVDPAGGGGGGGGEGGGGVTGWMDKLGMGDMPPWMKWSMLLQGASSLGQLGYGIYDNERARKRGDRFGDYLSRTAPSRPPAGRMY